MLATPLRALRAFAVAAVLALVLLPAAAAGDPPVPPDHPDPCPENVPSHSCDYDKDGVPDELDNCPWVANPGQEDSDGDGIGDACDSGDDQDGDGIPNSADNCPSIWNPDQSDRDRDGIGDVCDPTPDDETPPDRDSDGIPDANDNCPDHYNPYQEDSDGDGIGDACEDSDPPPPDPDEPPEYDPSYAEGGFNDNLSTRVICEEPCATTSRDASPDAVPAACAGAGRVRITASAIKKNRVTKIWRLTLRATFCWKGGRVVGIYNREHFAEILIPDWARAFYPWTATITGDFPGDVPQRKLTTKVYYRFQMCSTFRSGPICVTDDVSIGITVLGDRSDPRWPGWCQFSEGGDECRRVY